MARNCSIRSRKPRLSCCQSRLCRNTRMLVKPSDCAQPSSRSIVAGSNVSACHISSWLIAELGVKLQPTSQLFSAYQTLAFSAGQRVGIVALSARQTDAAQTMLAKMISRKFFLRFMVFFLVLFSAFQGNGCGVTVGVQCGPSGVQSSLSTHNWRFVIFSSHA